MAGLCNNPHSVKPFVMCKLLKINRKLCDYDNKQLCQLRTIDRHRGQCYSNSSWPGNPIGLVTSLNLLLNSRKSTNRSSTALPSSECSIFVKPQPWNLCAAPARRRGARTSL